jgi:hypothetical protein
MIRHWLGAGEENPAADGDSGSATFVKLGAPFTIRPA